MRFLDHCTKTTDQFKLINPYFYAEIFSLNSLNVYNMKSAFKKRLLK